MKSIQQLKRLSPSYNNRVNQDARKLWPIAPALCVNREYRMEVFELIQGLERTDENLIRSSEEVDKAIDHTVHLIQNAYTLYFVSSYPSSAFSNQWGQSLTPLVCLKTNRSAWNEKSIHKYNIDYSFGFSFFRFIACIINFRK